MEIKLAENEQVIRNYRIADDGKKIKNTVDVTVTNKRLMRTVSIVGAGSSSTDVDQIPIDNIHNMACGTSFKRRLSWVILGAVLAFVSLILCIMNLANKEAATGIIILLVGGGVGVGLIILGLFKKNHAYMDIYTSRTERAFTLGKKIVTVAKIDIKKKKALEPDLIKMIDELPALIIDIKELGDVACEKWSHLK